MSDLGRPSGYLAIGTVVDHENDPTQTGQVRVRWLSGAAEQHDIQDKDLPWTKPLFSSTNPSSNQAGGPHTGLRKGSTVVGIPLDGSGQDFLILGSIVKGGTGSIDKTNQFDSDIPQQAKVQSNGGETQPRYGDVNGVVTQSSIVSYAENEAGGGPGKYCGLDDSIGTLSQEIA